VSRNHSIQAVAGSDEHLALIARLYHVDGLGQHEVAALANVSQAKVSRLLAVAKERGIVRITVADYEPRAGMKGDDLRRTVGYFGAAAVDTLIAPRNIVALAGGRTIYELIRHLPHLTGGAAKSLTVVQAMGSVASKVSVFDAQEVGRDMAQRLGGVFLSLNTPAFIPEKRTRDALMELEQVRGVRDNLGRARVAIVGLGTLTNSVFVEHGTLDARMTDELKRAGAVGEICGRFIDASGRECETPWRHRVISVQIEQLRKIPQVIAVVSGSDRSAAIFAAVKGGVIKSLVMDEAGARALLEHGPLLKSRSILKRRKLA
jgi:DNA-binding transcriptional regulator LsrR (DeoR family)